MRLKYLGTAAAEGIPAVFCSCTICENARLRHGREIRSRSQVLVDDELMIDFPPDTFYHAMRNNLNLGGIHTLLITHDHFDHWFPAELINRHSAYQRGAEEILHVYGNETVWQSFENHLRTKICQDHTIDNYVQFHRIHGGERFQRGSWEITAIPADHDKQQECLIYLCKKSGKTFLYGHDTGICLSEGAWEILKTSRIDLISLDATMGRETCPYNHMGLPEVKLFLKKLKTLGCVSEETICVISHFSHNGGMTQTELETWGDAHNILAAYDGMEILV